MVVQCALWFRYRIKVKGLDEVLERYGNRGILFLPNHPALIDPVIVCSVLFKKFTPRALAHERQIKGTILKHFWKPLGVLPIPDMESAGREGHDMVVGQITACSDALNNGDNVLFYPAGRIYRSYLEKLRGNGGAHMVIKKCNEPKVVMVRTSGLWGSDFSRAKGHQIHFGEGLKRGIKNVLFNLLFFMPRRSVTVEFVPAPEDFPFDQPKNVLNRYLENFYNATAAGNTYVPYGWWDWKGTRQLPEPENQPGNEETDEVPLDIKAAVIAKLKEYTGRDTIKDSDTLGTDLGLDSLVVAELVFWIQETYGQSIENTELLHTVASLELAAAGKLSVKQPLQRVPDNWFYTDGEPLVCARAKTIAESFLINAKRYPNRPVFAEQGRGVCTNKKAVLAVMVLTKAISKYPDEKIGMMMPATMVTTLLYLAIVFAGKIPVMLNWTVGNRNLKHCIKNAGVDTIITAAALVEKLRGNGVDFTDVEEHFQYLENISEDISVFTKLGCLLKSKISWGSLRKAKVKDIAAILFTSGSENLPKAVPLTHENMITDLHYAIHRMHFRKDISMVGMLPPFHSLGLLLNVIFPVCTNIRCVYHPNPTDGEMLARLIAAYRTTFACGTPTFMANIMKHGTREQFKSLQYVVTGAEKCSEAVFELFREKCNNVRVFEGYGITECGPVVSLATAEASKPGTIGRPIDCTEAIVTNEDCTQEVPANTTGMLLVRGPSIFKGYLNYDGPSPFVELNGKTWYKTGDLVQLDEEGFVIFKGRLKRFVKLGGEMISLPAIEDVLNEKYRNPDQDGPTLAVEATGGEEHPVITLFTTVPLDKEEVNQTLRSAGFSPLQSIREVVKMDTIPILGTGKTDYRTLRGK